MKNRCISVLLTMTLLVLQLSTGIHAFDGIVSDEADPEAVTDWEDSDIEAAPFYDTQGHWAEETINALAIAGIINGREKWVFDPEGNVTRAEFVKLIVCAVEAFDEPHTDGKFAFADVDIQDWYYPYIECALHEGIIDADSEFSCFFPTTDITRADAAIMIASALKITGLHECSFSDVTDEKTSKAVSADVAAGIVFGYEDMTFRPNSTLTRAEAAVLVERVTEYYKKENTSRESVLNAKYNDQLIIIKNDGNNRLASVDDTTGSLVFENPTEEMKKLAPGDVLYIEGSELYPEGGAVKVEKLDITESTVTIIASTPSLDEVFSKMDISKRISVSSEDYLEGSSDSGVVLVPSNGTGKNEVLYFELRNSRRATLNSTATLLDRKASFKENGFSGELHIKSDFLCDILYTSASGASDEKNDPYVKVVCETDVDSFLAYEKGAKAETSIKLGSFQVRVYGPLVVFADFYLKSSAEGNFKLEVKASYKNRSGIYADTQRAYLINGNESNATLTADADGELRAGPSVTLGLGMSCLFTTLSFVDMDLSLGLGVNGETSVDHAIKNSDGSVSYRAHNTVPDENGDIHICDLCIDGETFIYTDVDLGIDRDLTKALKIDAIRANEDIKTKINDWYYSVSSKTGNTFDYGTCPNYYKQLEVKQDLSDCKAYAGDTVVLTASFGIGESGAKPKTHPILYKWYKNNTELPGATEETLTLPNASENDTGHYYCLAYYSELGEELLSAKSRTSAVEIIKPVIQFTNAGKWKYDFMREAVMGGYIDADPVGSLTLYAEAKASTGEVCTYQWYRDGSPVSGATQATLHFPSLRKMRGTIGRYYCVVSVGNEERISPSFFVLVYRDC